MWGVGLWEINPITNVFVGRCNKKWKRRKMQHNLHPTTKDFCHFFSHTCCNWKRWCLGTKCGLSNSSWSKMFRTNSPIVLHYSSFSSSSCMTFTYPFPYRTDLTFVFSYVAIHYLFPHVHELLHCFDWQVFATRFSLCINKKSQKSWSNVQVVKCLVEGAPIIRCKPCVGWWNPWTWYEWRLPHHHFTWINPTKAKPSCHFDECYFQCWAIFSLLWWCSHAEYSCMYVINFLKK